MQREKKTTKSASVPLKRKKIALGKGLGALIPGIETAEAAQADYRECGVPSAFFCDGCFEIFFF